VTSLFKHNDDDGDLSIFASGKEVLFVCNQGHWWVVDAASTGTAPKAAAKRAQQGIVPQRITAADKSLTALSERFGSHVFNAMSFK